MTIATRLSIERLLILLALACGIIGLIAGIIDRQWKFGVMGWFTGGILLAVIAIALVVDGYIASRAKS